MVQNKLLRMGLLVLALLIILSGAGCKEAANRFTLLLHGTYEVPPTPYITPVARGTPASLITPFPHETPVFDEEKCATMDGEAYFTEAQAQYQVFRTLKGPASQASREDLPSIIDEMREIHGKFQALKPPMECEIFVVIDTHMEAEVDQTIRAFIAFHNLEPEETVMEYLNEALLHSRKVEELLAQVK